MEKFVRGIRVGEGCEREKDVKGKPQKPFCKIISCIDSFIHYYPFRLIYLSAVAVDFQLSSGDQRKNCFSCGSRHS